MNHYLYTCFSPYGMGSDSVTFYVTEDRMRDLIRKELEKKKNGKKYDEQLVGEWKGGRPPKDGGKKTEDYVLKRMLKQTTTYSKWPDLIKIPEDVQPVIRKYEFSRKVFITENEYLCPFEVYIGHIEFTRYDITLPDEDVFKPLKKQNMEIFLEFSAENVLINGIYTAESLNDWVEKKGSLYFKEDLLKKLERKAKMPIRNTPPLKEQYIDVRWHPESEENKKAPDYIEEWLEESLIQKRVFPMYPFRLKWLGLEIECLKDEPEEFHPDEIFETGAAVKILPINVGSKSNSEEIPVMAMRWALHYAFQE